MTIAFLSEFRSLTQIYLHTPITSQNLVLFQVRRNAEAFNSLVTSLLEILGCPDSYLIPPSIQQCRICLTNSRPFRDTWFTRFERFPYVKPPALPEDIYWLDSAYPDLFEYGNPVSKGSNRSQELLGQKPRKRMTRLAVRGVKARNSRDSGWS